MHPQLLGRDVGRRGGERLDVGGDRPEKLGLGHVLVAGVAAHREIGAVELKRKAGFDDRLVLGPHRLDEVGEIGLMARIELVRLERGDEAGAGRVHERGDAVAVRLERAPEAADIVV